VKKFFLTTPGQITLTWEQQYPSNCYPNPNISRQLDNAIKNAEKILANNQPKQNNTSTIKKKHK